MLGVGDGLGVLVLTGVGVLVILGVREDMGVVVIVGVMVGVHEGGNRNPTSSDANAATVPAMDVSNASASLMNIPGKKFNIMNAIVTKRITRLTLMNTVFGFSLLEESDSCRLLLFVPPFVRRASIG